MQCSSTASTNNLKVLLAVIVDLLTKIMKQLKVPREEVVIATKIHTSKDPDVNSIKTINKKHITEGIISSLKRLQMDYVDVIYAQF